MDAALGHAQTTAERWRQVAGARTRTRQRRVFVAAHIIHLLAAATVFDAYGTKFVIVSAFMLAATAVLAVTPLSLRRPDHHG